MQSIHPHLFENSLTFDHSFAYPYYAITPGKLSYTPLHTATATYASQLGDMQPRRTKRFDFSEVFESVRQAKHQAFGPPSSVPEHGLLLSISSSSVCWHVLGHAHKAAAALKRWVRLHSMINGQTTLDTSRAIGFPIHSTPTNSRDLEDAYV